MEKEALICKSHNPKEVFEKDCVHYFFWPIELGIGKLKIGKFKIPISPIKLLDYEPVKVLYFSKKLVVMTRFHYNILIYFNKPKLKNGKPIIDFVFGSHSPLIQTNPNAAKLGTINNFVGADARELDAFICLLAIFTKFLQGKLKTPLCETKTYQITKGIVKDEYVFNPSQMTSLIWLGTRPSAKELRNIGYGS